MKKNTERNSRIEEELMKSAAIFLNRESNRNSLITVTRAILSSDTRTAFIMVSVLPEDKEDSVLYFLKRLRADFKHYLRKETRIPRIPFIDFCIDSGEKNRQYLDKLSESQ